MNCAENEPVTPQDEVRQRSLSQRTFVTLSEALSWLAFGDAMDSNELSSQVQGVQPISHESNEESLRRFFEESEDFVDDWPGIGHFQERQQGLEKLGNAWLNLREAVEQRQICVRGRYSGTYSLEDARLADVKNLSGNELATFSQFDISTGGIQRRTEGTPEIIWDNHPQAQLRGYQSDPSDQRTIDGYLLVEVECAPLNKVASRTSSAGTEPPIAPTAKTEHELEHWLQKAFAADPDKKRTKASFQKEALASSEKRPSVRGFIRVWDALAPAEGRNRPGRKS